MRTVDEYAEQPGFDSKEEIIDTLTSHRLNPDAYTILSVDGNIYAVAFKDTNYVILTKGICAVKTNRLRQYVPFERLLWTAVPKWTDSSNQKMMMRNCMRTLERNHKIEMLWFGKGIDLDTEPHLESDAVTYMGRMLYGKL